MEEQLEFAELELRKNHHKTRKEILLAKMESLVPWHKLVAMIEPHYPKAGNGRRSYPLEGMLRVHDLQQWYNLCDAATEDSFHEIASMRRFSHLSLDKSIRDHTTIMKFLHLLEKYCLGRQVFGGINQFIEESGLHMKEGSSIGATILEAPSSTKNKNNERDPEMNQTKKGNQWHLGMKAHIGVDVKTELIHTFTTTSVNEHDLNQAHDLLHGEEKYVIAGSGYRGAKKLETLKETTADWYIAEQPSNVRKFKERPRINKVAIKTEYMKPIVRAFVEHPFMSIKC